MKPLIKRETNQSKRFHKFLAKEFLEAIIVGLLIGGTIFLTFLKNLFSSLWEFLKTIFQYPIAKLPEELLVYHLLLLIIIFALGIYLSFSIKRKLKKKGK